MKRKKILITTGDIDGIGPEVTFKALSKISPEEEYQYIVFRSKFDDNFCFSKLESGHNLKKVSHLKEALKENNADIVVISSDSSPARWVESAAETCKANLADAMVTAPLSKTEIINSGYSDIGHTEILKRVSQISSVYMTFLGNHFNVLLLTSHIPLKVVPSFINKVNIQESVKTAQVVVDLLCSSVKNKPIGFVGLNPHAGEHGLIGMEEIKIIKPTLDQLRYLGINVSEPLVPDAAFLPKNWNKYSIYVSPYHDQGLTAFKIAHGHDSGVHITFGLPFIRTSVNHGTAKDIFGQNKAKPESMIQSIHWAKKLIYSDIRKINQLKIDIGDEKNDHGSSDLPRV